MNDCSVNFVQCCWLMYLVKDSLKSGTFHYLFYSGHESLRYMYTVSARVHVNGSVRNIYTVYIFFTLSNVYS